MELWPDGLADLCACGEQNESKYDERDHQDDGEPDVVFLKALERLSETHQRKEPRI